MITFDFTQSYPNITALCFVLTGVLILLVDAKGYKSRNLGREARWSTRMGWLNISFGILLYLAGIAYLTWFW